MSKYTYEPYQQHITLLDGIKDIAPYFIKLPDPPPLKKFVNYGLPKEKQFFVREKLPTKVKNLNRKLKYEYITREEGLRIADNDPDIYEFIADQWHKRMNGIFIIIYGVPMYITGLHWFYLNYYPMAEGRLPDYRYPDMEYFYWRKYCVIDDPNVYGGIYFTGRRYGKSAKSGCELLEQASRSKKSYYGIQSKNDSSAKSFFLRFIRDEWQKLPFFFAPIHDGNANPTSEIRFDEPRKKDLRTEDEALGSVIDYKSTTETAYDGEKLHGYVLDEPGKFEEGDPAAVWDKVKYCLKNQDYIIGKASLISTVEELDKKGGKKFLNLWNASSRLPHHKRINSLGQTESGLVPYFTPADHGYIFDQYGFAIVKAPLPHQQKFRYNEMVGAGIKHEEALRKSKMGANELLLTERREKKSKWDRQDHQRKYPMTIEEAFVSAYKSSHFNPEKINEALGKYLYTERDTLEGHPYSMVQGNFMWKDSIIDSEVIFVPSSTGRWMVSYLLPQSESNKWEYKGAIKVPSNTMKGIAGADPYGFTVMSPNSNKQSMGTGYIWWHHDAVVDPEDKEESERITDDFIVEYVARPPSRDIYNEDMIMMCVYYGIKIFPEINKDHTMNYFYNRGYEGYLLFPRRAKKEGNRLVIEESKTAGAYATNSRYKDAIFSHFEWYVENRIHRCKFPRLIEDIRDVEYEDTQPYDLFMGSGYCLYASRMITRRPNLKKSEGYSSPMKAYSINTS